MRSTIELGPEWFVRGNVYYLPLCDTVSASGDVNMSAFDLWEALPGDGGVAGRWYAFEGVMRRTKRRDWVVISIFATFFSSPTVF